MRNKEKYWTAVLDSKTAWSNKYDRVLTRLKSGFFCEKTKPYKPVGKLYLEPSDLLLNSISSELKEQVSQANTSDTKRGSDYCFPVFIVR